MPDVVGVSELRRLLSALRGITSALDRVSEKLDAFDFALQDLIQKHSGSPAEPVESPRNRVVDLRQVLLAMPQPLAAPFYKMEWLPDGSGLATLGTKMVRLTPRLAILLDILAADGSGNSDGLVAWKSRDYAREQLMKKTGGGPVTSANLNTLVWRLRRELWQAGLPKHLIQTQPAQGLIRLLARRSAGETASPSN